MIGKAKTNLYLDIVLLVAFLAATEPAFTGLTLHEWLGLALGAALLTHLLFHYKWVIAVVSRFFQEMVLQARLNFVLNAALLTVFTLIIVSGVMISTTLGTPEFFGVSEAAMQAWRGIHGIASDLSLLLVGLHVALHWAWIVNAFKRYVLGRPPKVNAHPHPLYPTRPQNYFLMVLNRTRISTDMPDKHR